MELYVILFWLFFIWAVLAVDLLPMFVLRKITSGKQLSVGKQWVYSLITALVALTVALLIWILAFVPYAESTGVEWHLWIYVYDFMPGINLWIWSQWAFIISTALSFLWIKRFAFDQQSNTQK